MQPSHLSLGIEYLDSYMPMLPFFLFGLLKYFTKTAFAEKDAL